MQVSVFNIVIYPYPGPPVAETHRDVQRVLARHSVCDSDCEASHLVLNPPEFRMLWNDLDRGEMLSPAWSALDAFGDYGRDFIGRFEDVQYVWQGIDDHPCGRVMFLQVIARPSMLARLTPADWNRVLRCRIRRG